MSENGNGSFTAEYDVVVVGAGFTGVYAVNKFAKMGLSVRCFEKGGGIGGTWYWNAYPGARCDVESMEYSYQFDDDIQQEWNWTERYSSQPEIQRYIEHVANRLGIADRIQLDTRVVGAKFHEDGGYWVVETDKGDRAKASYVLLGTGCLSQPIEPDIKGMDDFAGRVEHTARWPHEDIDFTGLRVGIIGTGSSGAQLLTAICKTAKHVSVFQRTPAYVVPASNHRLTPEVQEYMKSHYGEIRAKAWTTRAGIRYGLGDRMAMEFSEEERNRMFEESWRRGGIGFTATFFDLFDSQEANDTAAEFVRNKISEIVKDPETAEALKPHDTIGCRRLLVVDGYYEAFNRDNVTLVNVKDTPIERIASDGIVVGGETHELDFIVLATGFDAMTGALTKMDIEGKNGVTMKDRMMSDPKAYMGMTFSDFPNMFTVHGPGAVAALSNLVPLIEYSVDWIADAIEFSRRAGKQLMEPMRDVEDTWAKDVDDQAKASLYVSCTSYYLGDNVPGKPRKFLLFQGVPEYVKRCNAVANGGYREFLFDGEPLSAEATAAE